jgi:DNA-binding PadR family transcriptional regulator
MQKKFLDKLQDLADRGLIKGEWSEEKNTFLFSATELGKQTVERREHDLDTRFPNGFRQRKRWNK